jgi:hypothetical protein
MGLNPYSEGWINSNCSLDYIQGQFSSIQNSLGSCTSWLSFVQYGFLKLSYCDVS